MIHGECKVCGTKVSTGDVDSKHALAYCGDCNGVTCGDHRDDSKAQRCTACVAHDEREDEVWCAQMAEAASSIREAIDYQRAIARDLRERAAECERFARNLEEAVLAGRWWEIEGTIGREATKALCNVEPSDRTEMLDPNAWL